MAEGLEADTVVGGIPTKPGFTYRLSGEAGRAGQLFSLDPQSGLITTAAQLDRETAEQHDLLVLSSKPTYPVEVRHTILKCIMQNDQALV